MRIVGLINKDSGPGFHRILCPLLLMPDVKVYITNAAKPEDFDGADWVYYNRQASKEILKTCREKGVKIAVDVDDYWVLDKHHIAYQEYIDNNFAFEQVMHLNFADMVTTTNERLAEKIRPINANVIVVPNAIPDHEYFSYTRHESELTRVFWQGSITHEADLKMMHSSIKRIDRRKNAMVIAGITENPVWDRMVKVFTRNGSLPQAIIPAADPFNYYRAYGFADIAVCPLIESQFNGFKSNLKVLEAANAMIPVICSNVHPYKDMPVLYAKNALDWHRHIAELTEDKEYAYSIASRLHEWCNEHHNFDNINKKRMQAFGIKQEA